MRRGVEVGESVKNLGCQKWGALDSECQAIHPAVKDVSCVRSHEEPVPVFLFRIEQYLTEHFGDVRGHAYLVTSETDQDIGEGRVEVESWQQRVVEGDTC